MNLIISINVQIILLTYIAPQYRNQGLGKDFYQAFEHWVSKQNISQIFLCAIKANKLGLRFWHKMGFQIIRETPPKQFGIKTHQLYVLNRTLNYVGVD